MCRCKNKSPPQFVRIRWNYYSVSANTNIFQLFAYVVSNMLRCLCGLIELRTQSERVPAPADVVASVVMAAEENGIGGHRQQQQQQQLRHHHDGWHTAPWAHYMQAKCARSRWCCAHDWAHNRSLAAATTTTTDGFGMNKHAIALHWIWISGTVR